MGEKLISEVKTRPIDRASLILKTVNKYRSNPSHAFEELSSLEDAPRSESQFGEYLINMLYGLNKRLVDNDKKYFPDASEQEIREKLFAPLIEYFENTEDRLILKDQKKNLLTLHGYPLDKGEINIDPLLAKLHGINDSMNAIVNYGPTPLNFPRIKMYDYLLHPSSVHSDEMFIAFYEHDIGFLGGWGILQFMDKGFIRANYRIDVDSSRKTVAINISKSGSKVKVSDKGIDFTPVTEGFIKILTDSYKENIDEKDKQINELKEFLSKSFLAKRQVDILEEEVSKIVPPEVKPVAINKPKELIPKEYAEKIQKMLDTSTCDVIGIELKILGATLMVDYGDLDTGGRVIDAYGKIKDLLPHKTFREHDTLDQRNKITGVLNEVITKQDWYDRHARAKA